MVKRLSLIHIYNVVALLPDGDDSFLMVTENNGLFRYNGDITPRTIYDYYN